MKNVLIMASYTAGVYICFDIDMRSGFIAMALGFLALPRLLGLKK